MPLTIIAYEPLSEQGLYARGFIQDITPNIEGYNHIISAVGGFDTAGFTLKGTRDELDDWFDDGLMRRVAVHNPEGIQVWEGYVSRMRYVVGTLVKTKTIDNLYNRIVMRYAPLDFSVFPPIAGAPVTHTFNDVASQQDFGVKALVISAGERTDSTAYDWARTVLKDRKDIQIGENVNTAGQDALSIEIECRGYWHTLKWLPYENSKTGTIQAHQVVEEIIRDFNDTNQGWFPMDFGWLEYNFRKERRSSDSLQSHFEVLKNIIDEGGSGGERWVGGFYQDRRFQYKAAEDIGGLYTEHFDLYRALDDPAQMIFDSALGTEVKPWDMVPDRILKTVDDLSDDMYIEQVTFRAPYSLTLVGGDDQRLNVFLKQRGLPSI